MPRTKRKDIEDHHRRFEAAIKRKKDKEKARRQFPFHEPILETCPY
jgi:hypothetical protein